MPKNGEKIVYYIAGYSKSRDQIDAILDAYNTYLKPYGVKPLWNGAMQDILITESDIKNMNDKERMI